MIVTTFGLTRLTLHTTDACHDGRIECAAASVEPAWYRDVQHDQCDRRGDWNRPVRLDHVGPIRKTHRSHHPGAADQSSRSGSDGASYQPRYAFVKVKRCPCTQRKNMSRIRGLNRVHGTGIKKASKHLSQLSSQLPNI